MVKSLSVVLIFWLLNIYKGILMSALPMAVHCQHECKHFTLSINFTVLLHKKLFLPINTDVVCKEKLH